MARHKTTTGAKQARSPVLIDVLPIALIDTPLEYILAEHARHRVVLAALQDFAKDRSTSRVNADMIAAFLTQDLPLHFEDEDDDLYPAVRRKVMPEDDLGAVLARLTDDHRRTQRQIDEIVAALCRNPARDRVRFKAHECQLMQSYAASEGRHLAIENSVVIAIAKIRLSAADFRTMSRNMKARRGVHV